MKIHIATEFSVFPGPRYEREGPFSAQEFREALLEPRFRRAEANGEELHVDLDGGFGYSTSFLEEAFGGLVREFGFKRVDRVLRFKSTDEPYLIHEIKRYMKETSSLAKAG